MASAASSAAGNDNECTTTSSWKNFPPYRSNDSAFVPKYRAACYCGAVAFEVRADPVDSKVCHCEACQRLHGAPYQWAVLFHKTDVRFVRGATEEDIYFYSAENPSKADGKRHLPCKLSCRRCRSPVADEGRRMFLAFGPLFDFSDGDGGSLSPPRSRVPPSFKPTCHIFYGQRVLDVRDGVPKYVGHKAKSALCGEDD